MSELGKDAKLSIASQFKLELCLRAKQVFVLNTVANIIQNVSKYLPIISSISHLGRSELNWSP